MLIQEKVKKLFGYNLETGVLTCKVDIHRNLKKGDIVRNKKLNGYTKVSVYGKNYRIY